MGLIRLAHFIKEFNKSRNICCIMVTCRIDKNDVNFILANRDVCDFFVINSCHSTAHDIYASELERAGIVYVQRPNIGYDTTAWKEFILSNYDLLCEYSMVILANNSCRYDFSIASYYEKAKQYQLYGLSIIGEDAPNQGKFPIHIQSYFISVRHDLFNSKFFEEYWISRPIIANRHDAIHQHELIFTQGMMRQGVKIGALFTNPPFKLFDIETYKTLEYCPMIVKKATSDVHGVYKRLLTTKKHIISGHRLMEML